MMQIQSSSQNYKTAFLHLGFRPFFAGAAIFAIVSMSIWLMVYEFGLLVDFRTLPAILWHGHEMIYGYSMAVIAGFLLTAVRNWTGEMTLNGIGLLVLFMLWLLARVLHFIPLPYITVIAPVTDLLFMVLLFVAVMMPVIKVRQWRQAGILSVLIFLFIGNLLFYLSINGLVRLTPQFGLYLGFYLILAMVFIMARRVVPFFIEKGVDYEVKLTNWLWLDILSIILFSAFAVSDLIWPDQQVNALLAAMLFILHSMRLVQWHTTGIWRKPLLWVLYLAYGFITIGFALKAAVYLFGVSPFIAMHAFSVGGIGMITIGMMSRVTLGHTGRNVFDPPGILYFIFLLMFLAAFFRVFMPLIIMSNYPLWITISQICWISSFAIFSIVFVPMFIKPRIDGQYG